MVPSIIITFMVVIFVLLFVFMEGSPIKKRLNWHREVNEVYQCLGCQRFRRMHQLSDGKSHQLSPTSGCECGFRMSTSWKPFTEEYDWMKHAPDFPRLSFVDSLKMYKLIHLLEKRKQEQQAYQAWMEHWNDSK